MFWGLGCAAVPFLGITIDRAFPQTGFAVELNIRLVLLYHGNSRGSIEIGEAQGILNQWVGSCDFRDRAKRMPTFLDNDKGIPKATTTGVVRSRIMEQAFPAGDMTVRAIDMRYVTRYGGK